MTDPITAYRDGKFVTEEAPSWFGDELEAAWNRADDFTVGRAPGSTIQFRKFKLDHGHTAFMAVNEEHGEDVWIPTGADLADFLTTRAPAFIGLSPGKGTS